MAIFGLYLLSIVCFGLTLRPNKKENTFLDKNFSNSIKTLFIFFIILSHIVGFYISKYEGVLSNELYLFRNFMGQIIVTPFFFISGFGIFEAYRRKGNDYNKELFFNHFLKILLFTTICLVPYLIYDLIVYGPRPFYHYLLCPFGITSLGNEHWFIFAILFVYLLTFFIGLFVKNNIFIKLALITVGCIGYIIVCVILGLESYFYNTIIAFPLGAIVSIFKNKIMLSLRKVPVAIATLAISIILYSLFTYLDWKGLMPDHIDYFLRNVFFVIGLVSFSRLFTAKASILQYFGINSWPLYLLHMLPILLFRELIPNHSAFYVTCFFVSLLLTIPFSILFNLISKKVFIKKLPAETLEAPNEKTN